jgi:hypothetical protein
VTELLEKEVLGVLDEALVHRWAPCGGKKEKPRRLRYALASKPIRIRPSWSGFR